MTREVERIASYMHEEDWLYPNYRAYMESMGNRPVRFQRFAHNLFDLLVAQLGFKDITHTDDKFGSRFHGVQLRAAPDDASLLLLDIAPNMKEGLEDIN